MLHQSFNHTPDLFSFATPAERSAFDEYHEHNPQVWEMFKRSLFSGSRPS